MNDPTEGYREGEIEMKGHEAGEEGRESEVDQRECSGSVPSFASLSIFKTVEQPSASPRLGV